MQNNIDFTKLENQVVECYSYFMQNHQNSNFNNLEDMLLKLQKSMNLLTVTNIVNIIDRVVEDGTKRKDGFNSQFNVSSVQLTSDNKIYLVCHEVLGFDEIDKKFILDNIQSYIDFAEVKKIY